MDKTKYSPVKTTEQEADDGIELKEFKKSETDENIMDVNPVKEEKSDEEEIDKTETENEVETPFLNEEIETIGLVRSTQENGTEEELERLTTTNGIDVIPREEQTTTTPTASNETNINIRFWLIAIGGVLIVLAAITALFLFFCVFTVNYEQIALSRNRMSGVVDTSRTYEAGLHIFLPWTELIKYSAVAHIYEENELKISTTDKLELNVTINSYYYLQKSELGLLYRKYTTNYKQVITKVIESTIMNEAQVFSVNDFRDKRSTVTKVLVEKLKQKLAENHVKLGSLYIGKITYPERILSLSLKRVIESILNEKAYYEKETSILRQNTTAMVESIRNLAKENIVNAQNNAKEFIVRRAYLDYEYQLDMLNVQLLNQTLDQLNFPPPLTKEAKQKRMSFCYLYELSKMKNLRFTPNNDQDLGIYY